MSTLSSNSRQTFVSLAQSAEQLSADTTKRYKRVTFYRNGDVNFGGLRYTMTSRELQRSIDSLKLRLNACSVGDRMPYGVRHIFTMDGVEVKSVDQLEDMQGYICSSNYSVKDLDYRSLNTPVWRRSHQQQVPQSDAEVAAAAAIAAQTPTVPLDEENSKIVTIIRAGPRPRQLTKMLINRKTTSNLEGVLNRLADTISFDTGYVRKLYSISKNQVTCIEDIFFDDSVIFIAFGSQKVTRNEFVLNKSEEDYAGEVLPNSTHIYTRSASTVPDVRLAPLDKERALSSHAIGVEAGPRIAKKVNRCTAGTEAMFPTKLAVKYTVGRVLGEGEYAVVKKCTNKVTRESYAMKMIDKFRLCDQCQLDVLHDEVAILRRLRHPNVIQLITDLETTTEIFLIMELVIGSDLLTTVLRAEVYREEEASGLLHQLCTALAYLHLNRIVHRNVKPENILISRGESSYGVLKLGDFGLATEAYRLQYTVCGHPSYTAPEIYMKNGYGVKVDIWSTGVVMFLLLCGYLPFDSATTPEDLEMILQGRVEFLSPDWDEVSEPAKDLVVSMLDVDERDRATAEEVLDHYWFQAEHQSTADLGPVVKQNLRKLAKTNTMKPNITILTTTALDKVPCYFSPPPLPGEQEDEENEEREAGEPEQTGPETNTKTDT